LYAVEVAEQMMARRSWASAAAQLREAFRCSASPAIARAVAMLIGRALVKPLWRRRDPTTSEGARGVRLRFLRDYRLG
jgi:hypothetical protein